VQVIVEPVDVNFTCTFMHGRRSRGDRGDKSPPEFGAGGTLIQIVPPQILSHRYKNERSVAFKIRQNRVFGRGSAPDPAGGAHNAPPDPLVGWRGDTPPHMPPHSTRTHLRQSPCVPPEVQPDLRLCLYDRQIGPCSAGANLTGRRVEPTDGPSGRLV